MEPPSYMRSVVDRNVFMRRMATFRCVHISDALFINNLDQHKKNTDFSFNIGSHIDMPFCEGWVELSVGQ